MMPKIHIFGEKCKSCGLCIEVCPKKVLAVGDKANSKGYYTIIAAEEDKCVSCALCALMCPDIALEVYKES
ncbi:4Fe-4S dicluster domain-containing protein [Sporomusa sphaeroides]|uniref:4Fe-4S dicluster domain-containing protein n=1 Tax=Sporomusa sphaeroides TaxID=47679 RepID=UPI002B50E834|nr:4Fe-4S dicluster domain-containing protein [Sporomusa sphaeroides]HML34878.1 4Fe-4S binding protein [Sporomusa sphaeroides]